MRKIRFYLDTFPIIMIGPDQDPIQRVITEEFFRAVAEKQNEYEIICITRSPKKLCPDLLALFYQLIVQIVPVYDCYPKFRNHLCTVLIFPVSEFKIFTT